ncbi:MAG: LysE family transporter [bacterium]|nr:LysE family transporter [bacterium]
MITDYLLPGVSLALSAVAIPGPLTAYVINIALQSGWRRSLIAVFSPLVTDPPIVTIILLALGAVTAALPGLTRIIQAAGGLLLLWIAYNGFRSYRKGATFGGGAGAPTVPVRPRQILATAMLMNLLSPGLYIFWTTVNGPLLLSGLQVSIWHGLAFLIGFYGVFFAGLALIGLVFARAGRIDVRLTRALMLGTILLLIFFGFRLIAAAITGA